MVALNEKVNLNRLWRNFDFKNATFLVRSTVMIWLPREEEQKTFEESSLFRCKVINLI